MPWDERNAAKDSGGGSDVCKGRTHSLPAILAPENLHTKRRKVENQEMARIAAVQAHRTPTFIAPRAILEKALPKGVKRIVDHNSSNNKTIMLRGKDRRRAQGSPPVPYRTAAGQGRDLLLRHMLTGTALH